MKYNSKEALLSDISREFNALVRTLDEIPPHRQLDPGVWGEDWNVRDLIAHSLRVALAFSHLVARGAEGRNA